MKLEFVIGDLTRQDVDAIVNAANRTLGGGGGVDGAIHRAAGPELVRACLALPTVAPGVRCPTGEARLTPGFRLSARHVIHTVGPVYDDEAPPRSDVLLARAHASVMALAAEHGLRTVAFPAISCGAYGFPLARAGRIARTAVLAARPGSVELVRFVFVDEGTRRAFCAWKVPGAGG